MGIGAHMWDEQIAAIVFVKRGKKGINCNILFLDGRKKTFNAPAFSRLKDVLKATEVKENKEEVKFPTNY